MYKSPLAGGRLLEGNCGGSCLCMVNREHFWKGMVANRERRRAGGRLDSCRHALPHCADLERKARSSLCICFSRTFQHCVHLVFEAAQRHIWCDRCTQHHEQQRTGAAEHQPVNTEPCKKTRNKKRNSFLFCHFASPQISVDFIGIFCHRLTLTRPD